MAVLHTHFLDRLGLVVAEGVLDAACAPQLSTLLSQVIDIASGHAVIDLSAVSRIDARTAGVLSVQWCRARGRGGDLKADGVHGLVLEVLEILALAKPLGVYDKGRHAPARPDLPCCAGTAGTPPVVRSGQASGRRLPDQTIHALLAESARLPAHDARRAQLRALAVEVALPAARRLAGCYRDGRDSREDLEQVAALGLIRAVDGFDPDRGHSFSDYALPTILGELRHHFRDHGWVVRVPRPMQELHLAIKHVTPELTQRLYRAPTAAELADALQADQADVVEVLAATGCYRPASLSTPVGDDPAELGDLLGAADPGFDRVDDRQAAQSAVAQMPDRLQQILTMRFVHGMTQSQIAAEFGVSQMHISRLLVKASTALRHALVDLDQATTD